MAPDASSPETADPPARKDPVGSLCGQVPTLSTGDRSALRRLRPAGGSGMADGVVVGLAMRAGVEHVEGFRVETFERWRLLAHVAAVLSGTAAVPPHQPGASLGRALHAARYSDHRLMRLTSARGPALADQIVRAARMLAAAGQVPVDLRTLFDLSRDVGPEAEAARLRLARDYYAAAHASAKDAS